MHDDSLGWALTRVLCGVGLAQRDSIRHQQTVHPRNSVLVLPLSATLERMVDFCRVRYVAETLGRVRPCAVLGAASADQSA